MAQAKARIWPWLGCLVYAEFARQRFSAGTCCKMVLPGETFVLLNLRLKGLHTTCIQSNKEHPGGNPEQTNLKSTSHRCHPILVASVWHLIQETVNLPLGCLQGGTCCKMVLHGETFVSLNLILNSLHTTCIERNKEVTCI
jgi:hypothetical protein